MKHWFTFLLIAATVGAMGCDRQDAPASVEPLVQAPTTSAKPGPRVVFLGDSLTAGLGLEADQAYPAIIAEALHDNGITAEVVNAGVSGDTTAGGLRRLDWLLKQSPDVVVVGLGGNDGLRGLDPKASEQNLRQIIEKSKAAGAKVLLLGMLIPPNYGPEYTAAFEEMYPRLSRELGVPLVPFLLEGVGGNAALNQADGIHPTAEGQKLVAKNVLTYLRPLLAAGAE
jgi:acyl-CoA thioesterase-1